MMDKFDVLDVNRIQSERIAKLEARIKELEARQIPEGWQPIETAPMDGSTIITAGGRDIALQYWGEDDNGDENWCPRARGMRQDYWMPAPEVK